MMIFINECYKNTLICKEHVKGFLTILSFFAPHVAEEINEIVFKDNTFLYNSDFPKINEVKNENKIINLPIQINGKLRIVIEINKNMTKQEIIDFLMKDSLFTKYLINNSYKNVIYVPNKIMNFII
jgi:leucyl-tRNA synthetase